MRTIKIRKGFEFETLEGKCVVESYNGSIVDCQEYLYNDETGESDIMGEPRRLTLNEIANEIKNIDGLNYKVVWEE